MKIITISREFGSGGRELGRRLAELLEFDYYDREIITAIAERKGLDADYVENALSTNLWKKSSLSTHHSSKDVIMLQQHQTDLLLEQKRVIEEIATKGRDFVIVGRNSDVILKEYHPFSVFVCADMESKLRRCAERAGKESTLTQKDIENNIKRIDKNRARIREMISDGKWGDRHNYDLIVNTSGWQIKEMTPAVAEYAKAWFQRKVWK